MRRAIPTTIAGLLALALAGSAHAQAAANDAYRLSPGDEIAMDFPYNPELNRAGPVGPDGRFVVPLLGNLVVAGRTLDEVSASVTQGLRNGGIVADARPVVSVRTYGAVVFVGGEVKQPGMVKLAMASDPLQAVILAGGLLDTAKSRKVVIIHRAADGSVERRTADLDAYTKQGLAPRVALAGQDIIFVPRSSVAEADRWIDQYINKLLPFGRTMTYNMGSMVAPVP